MHTPEADHLQHYLTTLAGLDKWPEIITVDVKNHSDAVDASSTGTVDAIVSLSVPRQLTWFDGHFPDQPVLPGIVHVHWAHSIASSVFQTVLDPHRLSRLKFKTPILPDAALKLHLNINKQKRLVKFSFRDETTEYSSGTLTVLSTKSHQEQTLVTS